MKCPVCVENGQRSTLHIEHSATTPMGHAPYYDEDGNYHDHDPNVTGNHYRCSKGHRFAIARYHPCPSCDYGHKDATVRVLS